MPLRSKSPNVMTNSHFRPAGRPGLGHAPRGLPAVGAARAPAPGWGGPGPRRGHRRTHEALFRGPQRPAAGRREVQVRRPPQKKRGRDASDKSAANQARHLSACMRKACISAHSACLSVCQNTYRAALVPSTLTGSLMAADITHASSSPAPWPQVQDRGCTGRLRGLANRQGRRGAGAGPCRDRCDGPR